jgi:hypothetical protein
MPYTHRNSKGQTYYLHGKDVTLQNGRRQRIYYFAREPKRGEAIDTLPPGHRIEESPRTGLPYLKRA